MANNDPSLNEAFSRLQILSSSGSSECNTNDNSMSTSTTTSDKGAGTTGLRCTAHEAAGHHTGTEATAGNDVAKQEGVDVVDWAATSRVAGRSRSLSTGW